MPKTAARPGGVPIPIPRVGENVYQRCSLGPGRTATRCPLVAAAGTAGWRERKAARREPELSDSAPAGKSTPFRPLRSTPGDPRPLFSVTKAGGRAGWGHGPHYSPHGVAQVLVVVVEQLKGVDLGAAEASQGQSGRGFREGAGPTQPGGPPPSNGQASPSCPQSLPTRRRGPWWEPTCHFLATQERPSLAGAGGGGCPHLGHRDRPGSLFGPQDGSHCRGGGSPASPA